MERESEIAVRVSSTIPLWSYEVSLHGGEDRVEADAVTGFPSTNVTVELWMRGLDPLAPGTPFSYATALNDHTFVLRNFGEFELYVAGESAGPTGFLLPDSQWHHIAATWRHHDGECRQMQVYAGRMERPISQKRLCLPLTCRC